MTQSTTHGLAGRLEGRRIWVTGASRGIGETIARTLAEVGARLVLTARSVDALERIAAELPGEGHLVLPGDVARIEDVEAIATAIDRAIDRVDGRLDGAVDGASVHHGPPVPLHELDPDDFDRTVAVGLRGLFLTLRAQLRLMLPGPGSIVTLASTAGIEGLAGLSDYSAVKHAVLGLTRSAALENAAAGIRVNAVTPGTIDGPRMAAVREAIATTIPMQRLGRAEEVAAAVAWLLGDDSRFVTGANLVVDGGRTAGSGNFAGLAGRPVTQRAGA